MDAIAGPGHKPISPQPIPNNNDPIISLESISFNVGQENDSANWKSGTAGILTTRLYNYVIANQKDMDKKDIKQYSELMLHNSFSVDQKFLLVRQVIGCGNRFSAILTGDPRFIKYMTT